MWIRKKFNFISLMTGSQLSIFLFIIKVYREANFNFKICQNDNF
jgi:hypothetical protein